MIVWYFYVFFGVNGSRQNEFEAHDDQSLLEFYLENWSKKYPEVKLEVR